MYFLHFTVADLHSKILDARPPRGSKFFQFHAVFGKIWQNRMLAPPPGELAPPPRGNPRSATVLCIALIHQKRRTNSSPTKRMKKDHMNSCLKLKNFRSILKAKIRKHTEYPLAWLVTLYELGVLVAFGLISSLLKFVNSNWLGDTWQMVEESWKGSEILKLW